VFLFIIFKKTSDSLEKRKKWVG